MKWHNLIELIVHINNIVNGFAWGSFGLVLLMGTGLVCTICTRFFQLTHLRHWISNTFGIINTKGRIFNDAGALSQRRAFYTALCATIGTGSIAGVAAAICAGGPGAVFWMWVAAFFGMMVKYSENLLGVYYRRRNIEGAWSGGAMYYLRDGLGSKKRLQKTGKILGAVFCIFTVLASFGIGNTSQISKITINTESVLLSNIEAGEFLGRSRMSWYIGILLMLFAALISLGGARRLAAVAEKLVPFMCISYILGCILVIILNGRALEALVSIFRFALGPDAVKGGVAGAAVHAALNTIKNGCKRGVFSNEAGLGSSVMVHCTSCAREPVRQGLWGISEVFLDTMVICTLTAMVILSSGFIDLNNGIMMEGVNESTLVAQIFGIRFGRAGEYFVVLSITLFAFTTVMGWSFYGAKVVEYLLGVIWAKVYRIVFVVLIVFGAVLEPNLVWDISDTFNGLMMIPNLIGIVALIPIIKKLTENYIDRRIRGKDIEPMLSYDSDIQLDAARAVKNGAD